MRVGPKGFAGFAAYQASAYQTVRIDIPGSQHGAGVSAEGNYIAWRIRIQRCALYIDLVAEHPGVPSSQATFFAFLQLDLYDGRAGGHGGGSIIQREATNWIKMAASDLQGVWTGGIRQHNAALVRVLGVSPLLAVSDTLVTAATLGVILLGLLMASNFLVAVTRNLVPVETRLPCYAILLATLVTMVDAGLRAWLYDLHLTLGIYLPVLAGSAIIVSRAEEFAARNRPLPALLDAAANGVGILVVFIVLAVLREGLAYGTLLQHVDLVGGQHLGLREIRLPFFSHGLLLAGLPAGGFIGLGLLAAWAKHLQHRRPVA